MNAYEKYYIGKNIIKILWVFLKLYFIIEKKNLTIASMEIGFRDSENGRRESKKSLICYGI